MATVPLNAAVYLVHKRPIRSVAVLGLALTVLVGQHLNAQTIVTYPVPTFYSANPEILFDGTKIWVTGGSSSVTKLLVSTGSVVGTYPAGQWPQGIAFDGTNTWTVNDTGFSVVGPFENSTA
jgi:hypothetical protein